MASVMSGQSRAQSSPAPRSAVVRPPLTEERENSGLEIDVMVSVFWRCVLATQVGQRKLIKKLQL